jgi:hypothetical protein
MLHILTFYKSGFRKIPRVQCHLFFDFPVSDLTPHGSYLDISLSVLHRYFKLKFKDETIIFPLPH